MTDVNELLSRLRNGETADDIVASFTSAINTANRTYEAEEKEKIRLQKEAEEKRATQVEDLQYVLDLFTDWWADYLGVETEEKDYPKAEDLLNSVDRFKNLFDFHSIFTTSETKNGKTTTTTVKNDNGKVTSTVENKKPINNKALATTDEIISEFLHNLNL